MTDTAHRVSLIELAPGETLESHGYTPDDILETEDGSYTNGRQRQDLLRIWVLKEVEV